MQLSVSPEQTRVSASAGDEITALGQEAAPGFQGTQDLLKVL